MQLSIIIVNFKSADLIIQSLASFLNNIKLSIEIIVVDNGNDKKDRENVLKNFPTVKWIDMGYNAGFARANNAGIKVANGNTVLLLNPDTIIIDKAIEKAYDRLNSSEFVATGVQQLNADNYPQISGNFFMKGGLNHLLPIPYWGGFIKWIGNKTNSKVPNIKQAKNVDEVDWISGAFLMVKKEVIEKAGLMDEDFFLYAEEVEWCSRLKKHGKLCIFGDLNIIHLEGATINKSQNLNEKGYYNLYDNKGLQLMVSNHLRVRKQYGTGWFLFLLLNYSWGVLVFFLCSFFYHLFTFQNPFKEFNRAGAFAKNVLKLYKISPIIISNKPHFYKMM